jgi:hypothetical protein
MEEGAAARSRCSNKFGLNPPSQSIVVTLLAGRYRDAQAILRRRQRTRRVGGECTGRVLQSIEIEPDFAGLGCRC